MQWLFRLELGSFGQILEFIRLDSGCFRQIGALSRSCWQFRPKLGVRPNLSCVRPDLACARPSQAVYDTSWIAFDQSAGSADHIEGALDQNSRCALRRSPWSCLRRSWADLTGPEVARHPS